MEYTHYKDLSYGRKIPVIIYTKQLDLLEGVQIIKRFPFIDAVGALVEESYFANASKDADAAVMAVRTISVGKTPKATQRVAAMTASSIGAYIGLKRYGDFPPMKEGRRGTVAVIDTGISQHIDFLVPNIRIVAFKDLVEYQNLPYDDNGHGTFISGVIAANGISSGGKICGSAPNAKLIAIKAMDKNGEADTLKVLEAMQWVADNKTRFDIGVVCMSFGCMPTKADPLVRGAEALTARGIVVVCASGNSGENNVLSPAISNSVISVGACNNKMTPASFTSRGIIKGRYKPDFYALGVNVNGLSNRGLFTKMSGTSVACPYVAGVALRLIGFNPEMSPLQTRSRLYKMAKFKDGFYYL